MASESWLIARATAPALRTAVDDRLGPLSDDADGPGGFRLGEREGHAYLLDVEGALFGQVSADAFVALSQQLQTLVVSCGYADESATAYFLAAERGQLVRLWMSMAAWAEPLQRGTPLSSEAAQPLDRPAGLYAAMEALGLAPRAWRQTGLGRTSSASEELQAQAAEREDGPLGALIEAHHQAHAREVPAPVTPTGAPRKPTIFDRLPAGGAAPSAPELTEAKAGEEPADAWTMVLAAYLVLLVVAMVVIGFLGLIGKMGGWKTLWWLVGLPVGSALVGLLGIFVVLVITALSMPGAARRNQRAVDRLSAGDPAAALPILEAELARAWRLTPKSLVALHYNAAIAHMRLGQLPRAEKLLRDLIAGKDVAGRGLAKVELTALLAIEGRVAEAQRMLAALEEANLDEDVATWPRALVVLRAGDAAARAALVTALSERWGEIMSKWEGRHRRYLTVMRAFAAPDDAAAQALLAALPPGEPNELSWMTGSWPELAAFVAARGMT